MSGECRVVIADDHRVIRDLFRLQITQDERGPFLIVGEASTGQEAVEACLQARPNLLVLDMMLPGLNGCEVMRRLAGPLPELRVLFFSGYAQAPLLAEALAMGAAGFVSKARSWPVVREALNLVAQGGKYFDPDVAHLAGLPGISPVQTLTSREREILQLVAEGHSNKEIAARLAISVKTVDKHRTRLMEKLGLHDATAVTRFAIRAGIISLG